MGSHPLTGIVSVTIGIILILGAFFRWRWLVDPPLEMSNYYSQALLKSIVGTRGVVWFTYFLGSLFIIGGAMGIFFNSSEFLRR